MSARAGVFVSLKKNGELRGCMGTAIPREENVAREIISNAVSAAARDPRFAPVRPEEVDALRISVDVLSNPEPVTGLGNLDPRRYGVIVGPAIVRDCSFRTWKGSIRPISRSPSRAEKPESERPNRPRSCGSK